MNRNWKSLPVPISNSQQEENSVFEIYPLCL